ncbi:WYL domain-containing protein [Desulfovibrio sp. OttesenSCG-928-G15]|nr:WYL domain-containing protein [Desulfovibrio sp. OttesenSCG-928-G15]
MPKKWNSDAKPGDKLLALYSLLLYAKRPFSMTELAEELNCSKQTVGRLLVQFESAHFGKLQRTQRGKEAFFQISRPTRPPLICLDHDGLQQIMLCRDLLRHMLPPSIKKQVDRTVQQASAYTEEEGAVFTSIARPLHKGRIDYAPHEMTLQTLLCAITEQRVCIVKYQSARHKEVREYEYAPRQLLSFHDSFQVSGWIVQPKGKAHPVLEHATTLAVHRCKEVTLTRRTSEHLPAPAVQESGLFGIMEDEPFAARIRFGQSAATYIAEREWSSEQKVTWHKDGSITLTLLAQSPAELISWVLGFEAEAEVLSPKWLREAMVEKITNMVARYTSPA